MELKSYFSVLRKRIWIVLITVTLTTAVVAGGSYFFLAPTYVATATVWVPTIGDVRTGTGDILRADRLMNTYAAVATSRPVLAELAQHLGIPARELKEMVAVSFEAQTELMYVKVSDPNPRLAADVANELAEILIRHSRRTTTGRDQRASLFAMAGVPTDPSWLGFLPTPYWREINIVLSVIVGLIAGIGLAFLFEYLDTTLYTREEIESTTELTTLGEIPTAKNRQQIAALNGNTLHGEAFRYLRTSLFFDQEVPPRTLLITSSLPGEGKSTIVANLALAVAQSQRTVIVVDTDLHIPTLHKIYSISNEVGLSSILQQGMPVDEAIQSTRIPGVQVITSGPLPRYPAELLDSPQVTVLIEDLKQRADLVLFDTPALRAVSDAVVLAPMVDGVILVVGRAQVRQEAVRVACQHLIGVNARLIGVVVNRTTQDDMLYQRYASKAG